MTAETKLDRVGVVGSGLMGSEIALVFALAGHDARLVDVSQDKLTAATQRLGTLLAKGVARGFHAAEQTDAALGRIATTTNLADLADRDLVVEEGVASVEDIDIACRLGLGHLMGPFELMDATTSSLCLQAQEIMHDAYGERFPAAAAVEAARASRLRGRTNCPRLASTKR